MKKFTVVKPSSNLRASLEKKIDFKTKPLNSLGILEELALQIGVIQERLNPELNHPHLLVFVGDHGIVDEGVSAYPQEVTWQMVNNFFGGGAAINVFCNQNGIHLKIVDAGVKYDFPEAHPDFISAKVGRGTANFLKSPAMALGELDECVNRGSKLVNQIYDSGCNVVGFGEMGIGNTSSATVMTSLLCDIPIPVCTGAGAGLSEEGVKEKIYVLENAIERHGRLSDPEAILMTFGGFEMAQMVGAMLQAAEKKMVILVDGFIATAAFLVANKICPDIIHYAVFCHQSGEPGHKLILNHLKVRPLLELNMRLGEGTGAAIAFPLIQSAVNFLNKMASFESAGISGKT